MLRQKPSIYRVPLIVFLLAILGCEGLQVGVETPEPAATDLAVSGTLWITPTNPPSVPTESSIIPADPAETSSTSSCATSDVCLVYINNGDVWLWTESGKPVSLTNTHDATQVVLSDDGRIVAFARQNPAAEYSYELWAINTDGSSLRLLVSAAQLSTWPDGYIPGEIAISPIPGQIEWQPFTHTLAYKPYAIIPGLGPAPPLNPIYLLDVDTLQRTELLTYYDEAGVFTFSPDGRQIAVATPDHISLINTVGGNYRAQVLTYSAPGIGDAPYYPHPVWAPDSSALRVAVPSMRIEDSLQALTSLWHIPTDGSQAQLLVTISQIDQSEPVNREIFSIWPAGRPNDVFAPSLEWIAYTRQIGVAPDHWYELHLARPDVGGDTVVAAGKIEFRQWSPDSAHFLYEAEGSLYLGDSSGKTSLMVNGPELGRRVQWIDANRFLYLKNNSGLWELHIMTLSGQDSLIDTVNYSTISFDCSQ